MELLIVIFVGSLLSAVYYPYGDGRGAIGGLISSLLPFLFLWIFAGDEITAPPASSDRR